MESEWSHHAVIFPEGHVGGLQQFAVYGKAYFATVGRDLSPAAVDPSGTRIDYRQHSEDETGKSSNELERLHCSAIEINRKHVAKNVNRAAV
jgi:hypothetical protein